MWIDSHCHLHLCEASPVDLLTRARAADVGPVVTIGIDLDSSRSSVALARELGIRCACGIHPNEATAWDEGVEAELDELLRDPVVVAVGETGLDYYRDSADPQVQVKVFRQHISLAKRHDKALVIHTRDSVDAALDVLEREEPPPRTIFHCWSGTPEQMGRAVALGAFVSFAGNVSFKSADQLREAARHVPPDRLLVETDSPYLSPHPLRGRPNEPAHVAHVGNAVAAARGEPPELVAETTTGNARRVFRLEE